VDYYLTSITLDKLDLNFLLFEFNLAIMKKIYPIIGTIVIIGIVLGIVFGMKNKTNDPTSHSESVEDHEDQAVADYEIYPGDVADKIAGKEDIILLDVRTPEEYAEIHLENSLLLPVDEISAKTLANIGLGESTKDQEIILYCRSGSRSKQAYDVMTSLGYTNLKSIQGGMVHWQEDNYSYTESGAYEGNEYSSAKSNVANGPRVSFDKTNYEFGKIERLGGTVSANFTLSNTGTETLTLGAITTSCGCTSATADSTSIEPNESTIVTVVFDPNFHKEPQGAFTRTVFIPTNDTTMPEAELTIAVEIIE